MVEFLIVLLRSRRGCEDLYKGENFTRPKLDGVSFPIIPLEVKNWLEESLRKRRCLKH